MLPLRPYGRSVGRSPASTTTCHGCAADPSGPTTSTTSPPSASTGSTWRWVCSTTTASEPRHRRSPATTTCASPTRSCSRFPDTTFGFKASATRSRTATSLRCGTSPVSTRRRGWSSSWACGTTRTTTAGVGPLVPDPRHRPGLRMRCTRRRQHRHCFVRSPTSRDSPSGSTTRAAFPTVGTSRSGTRCSAPSPTSGVPLEIDLHAKGVDHAIIDAAKKPNLRVVLSPKFAAEHVGLPYHQASIRAIRGAPGRSATVTS